LQNIVGGKIDGETDVKGRQGKRSKQLLDDLEMRGYCKFKGEELVPTVWRTNFERG
jgi:hypothetical protein